MTTPSRIIKREDLAPSPPMRFNPDDAVRTIQDQVAAANTKLEQERRQATTEVQSIYDKANREGYQAGYEKGLSQGLAEQEAAYSQRLQEEIKGRTASALSAVEQMIGDVKERPAEWVKSWEPEAMELITSIAGRVARRVVASDRQVIVDTLREILSMIARSPKITVRLHPADLETLNMNPDRWRGVVSKTSEIEFVPDPELTHGGCKVTTESCSIDATVETQIDRLLTEIAGELTPPSIPDATS